MMDSDPFINALADVDILKVEAVGRVIGRAVGAAYQGMIDAGVSERIASGIVNKAIDSAFAEIRRLAGESGEETP